MRLEDKDIKEISDQLTRDIDDQVRKSMINAQYGAATVSGPTALSSADLAEWQRKQKEEIIARAINTVNETLKEQGYPEFQKILDYYLEEHPEFQL